MAYSREFEINEAQIAEYLKQATSRVKTTENVDILADLYKLFKKNVPLTVRKYVIAYMFKESLKHFHFTGNNSRRERLDYKNRYDRNERNSYRENKSFDRSERNTESSYHTSSETTETTEERPRHPRVEIPEDQATSIFIGIGKNRRVYPKDLVGILIAVAGLERDRIGDIKVLANYSFVQLYTEDAQTAIDKLNDYDYRGRRLAVSYSRQKTDDFENDDENYEVEDQINDSQEMDADDAAAYAAAEKAAADKEPFGV